MTDEGRDIDLDEVVAILKREHNIEATVDQTGGGTATLYAGPSWTEMVDGGERIRFAACAGPGWFEGYGFTKGRASTLDLSVGPDDAYGEDERNYLAADAGWSESTVAAAIAQTVAREMARFPQLDEARLALGGAVAHLETVNSILSEIANLTRRRTEDADATAEGFARASNAERVARMAQDVAGRLLNLTGAIDTLAHGEEQR